MFIVMNIAMKGVQNVFRSYTNFTWQFIIWFLSVVGVIFEPCSDSFLYVSLSYGDTK